MKSGTRIGAALAPRGAPILRTATPALPKLNLRPPGRGSHAPLFAPAASSRAAAALIEI